MNSHCVVARLFSFFIIFSITIYLYLNIPFHIIFQAKYLKNLLFVNFNLFVFIVNVVLRTRSMCVGLHFMIFFMFAYYYYLYIFIIFGSYNNNRADIYWFFIENFLILPWFWELLSKGLCIWILHVVIMGIALRTIVACRSVHK